MNKPVCPRCNNLRMIIVQKYDSTSRIGFRQFAIPCPECRPSPKPPTSHDGKMAAAGDAL